MSFRWKLRLPIALIALVLTGVSVIAIQRVSELKDQSDHIAHLYMPGVDFLIEADRDLYQALVAERTSFFVDVGTEYFEQLRRDHDENMDQARTRVGKFAALIDTPEVNALLEQFDTLYDAWRLSTNAVMTADRLADNQESSRALELSLGKASEQFEAMREVIDTLTELTLESAQVTTDRVDAVARNAKLSAITALVVGLAFCLLLVLVFPGMITRPLHRIIHRVQDIAQGEGDLTARVQVNTRDELGQLGTALNQFIDKLQTVIGGIAGASAQVAAAAEQMSAITEEANRTVTEQESATDQIVTAVNQLSATVQEVARNASEAAAAAEQADLASKNGRDVFGQTAAAMEQLAQDIGTTTAVIQTLGHDSEQIGSILNVIREIAEQTNLLALNAAIEAARAGEQGRGFAVVADEVRALASRSQQSTQEIQGMIERLQTGSRNAVEAVEEGSEQAKDALAKAVKASDALEAMTGAVTQINTMNSQIATAAEEQNAVTEDINRNITHIGEVAQQNAQSSRQTATASGQLAALAGDLQAMVGHFKV
nr:methyl-accepting chemotaxis protein [Rhabdochromatium marinum]